ncbi:MAG TPA: hypothetical protein VLK84_21145 [Longimicrobium sp.]|nr:hypothetical protein [Longimicrobium sp.]
MARISIEDLTVDSFITGNEPRLWDGGIGEDAIAPQPKTIYDPCICTGDISTCSRTSPQGGCDTSVQCVTG